MKNSGYNTLNDAAETRIVLIAQATSRLKCEMCQMTEYTDQRQKRFSSFKRSFYISAGRIHCTVAETLKSTLTPLTYIEDDLVNIYIKTVLPAEIKYAICKQDEICRRYIFNICERTLAK